MPEPILKIKRVPHEGVELPLPRRATPGSAGLDLCAAVAQPVTVQPGEFTRIPTGIAVGFPSPAYAGYVFARSGLAVRHGITLPNGVGLIDSDYTGEIQVAICNISKEPYTIRPGERIAQLVVAPVCLPRIEETDSLPATGRGAGGFGSTGRL